MAENAWNTRDPERVSLAYTVDSTWRNRAEFLSGREAIVQFLQRKWAKELDYRLIKELWAFHETRIAVRFAYEWHDDSGTWFRSYGNENWEFDEHGLMRRRIASINDLPMRKRTVSTAGRWADAQIITQTCRTLVCSPDTVSRGRLAAPNAMEASAASGLRRASMRINQQNRPRK